MVHAKPEQRPACSDILQNPAVGPVGTMQDTIALREVRSTLEAERSQRLEAERFAAAVQTQKAEVQRRADEYLQELLLYKKRELLDSGTHEADTTPMQTPGRALKMRRTA